MENKRKLEVAEKLKAKNPSAIHMFIGFDGFIDTAVHAVDVRTGPDTYIPVKTIEQYGQKFLAAAGLSMNIEMVPYQSKLGGISLILANSLANLSADVTFAGALGSGHILPAFEDFASKAHVYSICDPAQSDAIEFQDGKVISSKLEPLKEENWENLKKVLPVDELVKIFEKIDLAAFGGWALSINSQTIWEGILNEVLPKVKRDTVPNLFVDLSDPAKRTPEDIRSALACVQKFSKYFTVGMGFNEKESFEITELFGAGRADFTEMKQVPVFLKEKLGLSYVVVHPVRAAVGADNQENPRVDGPYCPKPKLTTGAGDNFNAGFLLGKMLGFSLEEALLVGTANSGFYVRNARSASYSELINFIERWANNEV